MKNLKTIFTFLIACCCFTILVNGQRVAPYSLSPKWVFGNKGMFDFTTGSTPSQPARPAGDNIIGNEGSSTLCSPNKNVLVYDNDVRVGGNNNVPLGSPYMAGSSSSTQGGVIIPNPSSSTQFYIITGNAEQTYTFQEPNDAATQGIKVYSSSQSGSSVTAPSLAATLFPAGTGSPEQLAAGVDDNYGYWIIYQIGTFYASGDPNFNAVNVSNTGTISGSAVSSTYNTNGNWSMQAQGSIKLNRCQNKIAIVQSTKIAVFNWDRATGQIGSVIKYITGVNVGGGQKLYGCEFSANGNYLYVSTLAASDLIVVDLTVAGTSTGLSTKAGQAASGSLQIGPNDVIYVANGLDATDNTTAVGTITNANSGGVYNPTGLALANGSSVRLGISNIPWLNPQKPTIASSAGTCGTFTFTPSFKTYFNDGIAYNKAVWDFGDGNTVTTTNQSSYNAVTHTYSTTGNKNVTVTLTDSVCSYNWVGTLTQSVPCVLPVTLISFNGQKVEDNIVLSWATSAETNNKNFEILRSTDGFNFTSIGFMNGSGTSNMTNNYRFIDYEPYAGTNYYKLIQHDYDGHSESSETIAIKSDAVFLSVYPNPSSSNFKVKLSKGNKGVLSVADITGKEILTMEINEETSELVIGDNWADGAYVIELITDQFVKATQVFKGAKH